MLKRSDDHCFRLGGEEFGILFKCEKEDEAYKFAKSIHAAINALEIPHPKSSVASHITTSMGFVSREAKLIASADKHYKEVDDCMYKAKTNGRNRVISNLD